MAENKLDIVGTEVDRDNPALSEEGDEGQLALDIFETPETIFVVAPIAGIEEKSLDISVTDDLLIIKGNRPRPDSIPTGVDYIIDECYWGTFSRNILMPTAVNSADIIARLERDIVIVEIPKARKVKTKKISLSQ